MIASAAPAPARVKSARRGDALIEYIEVTLDDIALANAIAHEVLGRSLDELPPQTRRLLKLIDGYVGAECERLKIKHADVRFSRRSLREAIGWGDTQTKTHLARLVELEYLVAHRTKTGGFEYELVYDAVDTHGSLRLPGLADIEALAFAYDGARSGQDDAQSAFGRGVVGPGRRVVGVTDRLQSQHPCGLTTMRPMRTTKRTAPRQRTNTRRTHSPSCSPSP